MKKLQTIENTTDGTACEQHILEIPICCPISKNPRSGSVLTISYYPHGYSLEIGSLYAYIHQYRGGLYNDLGVLEIRDMEGMIFRIAQDCARVLHLPVTVEANLVLIPSQKMSFTVEALGEAE